MAPNLSPPKQVGVRRSFLPAEASPVLRIRFSVREEGRDGVFDRCPESAHVVAGSPSPARNSRPSDGQEWIVGYQRAVQQRRVEAQIVRVSAEIDVAAKHVPRAAQSARPLVDEVDDERRYPLTDKLPAKPDESQCEALHLVPVEVPRHPGIG